MNRDDRLFAIIGGTLVTVFAVVFLVLAGGITGDIDHGPEVAVRPLSAPADHRPPETKTLDDRAPEEAAPGVIPAADHGVRAPTGSELVRTMAAGLSAHPRWAAWLVPDDLLETFVAAVEAVADGYSPADELGFITVGGPFLVREDADRLVIAAGTYRRYDLAVEVMTSIDAHRAVEILRALEPEIEAIRRGMAWTRGDFEDRLRQATDQLLEVEAPAGPIEVERRTTSYAFACDEHEALSGAQRQLLRMGPSNAAAVQAKLREIRTAFGWPEPAPAPAPPVLVADASVGAAAGPEVGALEPEPMMTPFDPRVSGIAIPLLTEATVMAGGVFEPETIATPFAFDAPAAGPSAGPVFTDATAVP
ncbi:MAG: DUF3014 domain-containing protein [Thermoanaerobaculales bacterium]|jgi:hypothetical protein|nr:DUF3014 domain-containing protein [Thermoanaerobaculales bacterium]